MNFSPGDRVGYKNDVGIYGVVVDVPLRDDLAGYVPVRFEKQQGLSWVPATSLHKIELREPTN